LLELGTARDLQWTVDSPGRRETFWFSEDGCPLSGTSHRALMVGSPSAWLFEETEPSLRPSASELGRLWRFDLCLRRLPFLRRIKQRVGEGDDDFPHRQLFEPLLRDSGFAVAGPSQLAVNCRRRGRVVAQVSRQGAAVPARI